MTNLILILAGVASAISVHEFGHAYVAHLLGDDTAKNSGRMTLNPLAHVDPIGLICMIFLKIGWATPVPINSRNFKSGNMKRDLVLVSLAGATFNVITAIICALMMRIINLDSARLVLMMIISYNISFAAFNLIPFIPPLDGWQILKQFIPYKYYESVYKFEGMSMFIFLIVILTDAHLMIMGPISSVFYNIIMFILGFNI